MPERLMPRLGWLVFAAVTIGLLVGLLRQQVDPANRALKVPDSVDARRLQQLGEIVPDDPVVLLGFVTHGNVVLADRDRQALAGLQEELLELAGVTDCKLPTIPDPGLAVMAVALGDELSGSEQFALAQTVVRRAEALAPPSVRVLATGLPLIEGTVARLVAGERTTIVPLLLAVLFAAAWLFYRRLRLATAVLLPALCAIAWTGGTVAWLGHRLDPVAALLDPVLLTIGVAASVHFVEAFRRARAAGHAPTAAVARARALLRRPAFWATTTTMLGLWSLTTNDTPAVIDFGLRAALGVALTHLFTFLILPAWLAATPTAMAAQPASEQHLGRDWLHVLRRFDTAIVSVTAAISALAAAGLGDLRTDNEVLRMVPTAERARRDYDVLAARLGAVESFYLLAPARSAGVDPSRLLPFLAAMRLQPGIIGIAGAVQRGAGGDLVVPLLLAPGGSAVREKVFDDVERAAEVLGLDGLVAAGPAVQIARDSNRLMHGLLGSLGLSLLLLTTAIACSLGSLRLALFAMVPSLLPSLWLYGGLGWWGRPVSVATAMIGCTMLGLIVDNTLHLLHHYRHARKGSTRGLAMQHALDRCGRAMTLSSAVLMLGFLTAATSRLETTVEFALLATATIAMAWFFTAVLLPTLLLAFGDRQPDPEPRRSK